MGGGGVKIDYRKMMAKKRTELEQKQFRASTESVANSQLTFLKDFTYKPSPWKSLAEYELAQEEISAIERELLDNFYRAWDNADEV